MWYRTWIDLEVKWHGCQAGHLSGRSKTNLFFSRAVDVIIGLKSWCCYNERPGLNFFVKKNSYHPENFNIHDDYLSKVTQLNTKNSQTIQFFKKWAAGLKNMFPRRRMVRPAGAGKGVQHHSSLGKMQVTTTTRYCFTLVGMAITKKPTNNKWWRCGEKGTLVSVSGNVNWCSHCGNRNGDSSKIKKKKKKELPNDPPIPLMRIYSNKTKTPQKDICTPPCAFQHYF